ncbi:hypothetical protein HanRHA438_Chr05g0225961 [Helianthus annuus]|nr:hypothetical protein HanRHA438_Chr05g0225961 [Helianthus annuus]
MSALTKPSVGADTVIVVAFHWAKWAAGIIVPGSCLALPNWTNKFTILSPFKITILPSVKNYVFALA